MHFLEYLFILGNAPVHFLEYLFILGNALVHFLIIFCLYLVMQQYLYTMNILIFGNASVHFLIISIYSWKLYSSTVF